MEPKGETLKQLLKEALFLQHKTPPLPPARVGSRSRVRVVCGVMAADALQGPTAGVLYPPLMPHAKHMDILMQTTTRLLNQPLQEARVCRARDFNLGKLCLSCLTTFYYMSTFYCIKGSEYICI